MVRAYGHRVGFHCGLQNEHLASYCTDPNKYMDSTCIFVNTLIDSIRSHQRSGILYLGHRVSPHWKRVTSHNLS